MNSSKVILIALASTLALFVTALLVGAGLLHSTLMQSRIQEQLSRVLRMEVRFESFRPSIFGATHLGAFTASGVGGDSLSAREIVLSLRLFPLLRGRIVFSSLEVADLRFVKLEQEVVLSSQGAAGKPPESPAKVLAAPQKNPLRDLGDVKVTNAVVDWLGANGRSKMQLAGVNVSIAPVGDGGSEGELRIQQCNFFETIALTGVETRLVFSDDTLSAKGFTAKCGGGLVEGDGEFGIRGVQPFTLRLSGAGMDLSAMSQELVAVRLSGAAEGALECKGSWVDQASWVGGGRLEVRNGTFPRVEFLQTIGQLFHIQELAALKLRLGEVRFRVGEGYVWLDQCRLDGGDVVLAVPGKIAFGGALDLNSQLSLPESALGGKLGQIFGDRFSPTDPEGRRSVAFHVTGTVERPKTDLMERVVGGDLGKVVGGVLEGLFKPRKAAEVKTEKVDGPERAVAPAPNP